MDTQELVTTLLDAAATLTRRFDRSLSAIKGISFSEYQMLSALRDQPASTATRVDLAASISVTPSGVTRALKPLEKLGFVETVKDARDARKSLASLTPAGHELIRDADGVVQDTIEGLTVLGELIENERTRFVEVLGQLSKS